ncbi:MULTISPECIES: tripartite tricarboxylate transporter substrate binding protein [unclassified Beijerinckia]|uniref:Bug family tripartite tricarboxylate transporter substrate binding protein n=1 Tax=unclassified Beijerinckia TaxID=2638183 RepID=UPI00089D0F64|nr:MULTISPECIES: tripartite tricarboxylate transporter substrate binding protein [unclassified Beijerinckia]MDH7799674.1 tripartite-type tricarboxylate transporter receptor subunit TctC [Beijerinckia sp. GAS462]SEB49166.1 Tripartite-type tricarboxylate transporter, receptor component TctC [Beijerinckia sp. 28-YEA-48]
MLTRRYFTIGTAAACAAGVGPAWAQNYPTQDIRFVCGFAAGSGADVIVRFFAEKMKALAKRNIIVENRVGAVGNIATEYTIRAKPDGHTVYVTGGSALAAGQSMMKQPPFDIGKALQTVGTINRQPLMIAVRTDAPWKSLREFAEAMRAKGNRASYGTANPSARVVGAMFTKLAGLEAIEVQYRTGADFLNDLAAGNIDFSIADNVMAVAQEKAGRLRSLAVSTAERMQAAPEYPTMREEGFDTNLSGWFAAFVPADTPKPIVAQLNGWLNEVVLSPEGKAFLNTFASDPWANTPEEAQAQFLREIKNWEDYVKLANIEKQG